MKRLVRLLAELQPLIRAGRPMGIGTILKYVFPALCGILVLLLGLNTFAPAERGPAQADRTVHVVGVTPNLSKGIGDEQRVPAGLGSRDMQTVLTFAAIAAALGWVVYLLRSNALLANHAREERERADNLSHRLEHDPVTGLRTQPAFADRVRRALSCLKPGATLSVLNIDFTNELPKADRLGQVEEEKTLAASADLLRHALDTMEGGIDLARSSGKGFLVASSCDVSTAE